MACVSRPCLPECAATLLIAPASITSTSSERDCDGSHHARAIHKTGIEMGNRLGSAIDPARHSRDCRATAHGYCTGHVHLLASDFRWGRACRSGVSSAFGNQPGLEAPCRTGLPVHWRLFTV